MAHGYMYLLRVIYKIFTINILITFFLITKDVGGKDKTEDSGFNAVAVAVPVVLLLLILTAIIIVIVWYRRYVCYYIEAFYYPVRADCKGYAMEFIDVFLRFKFMLALYGAAARAILLLRQIS